MSPIDMRDRTVAVVRCAYGETNDVLEESRKTGWERLHDVIAVPKTQQVWLVLSREDGFAGRAADDVVDVVVDADNVPALARAMRRNLDGMRTLRDRLRDLAGRERGRPHTGGSQRMETEAAFIDNEIDRWEPYVNQLDLLLAAEDG